MSTSTHFTTPEFAEQWFHTHYKGYNHALSLEERDFLRHRVLEKPVFQNRLIRLRRKLSPAHVGPPCSCRSTSDSLDVQLASFARVRESKSMEGRHLEATRPAPSGSVVLHELPFASLLHERYQGQFCDTCFRKIVIGTRFQCRGCSLVYCSRECELSAWAGDNHAFFCGFDGLVELVGEDGWLCLKAYLRLAQSKETASDVEELMQGETPGDIGDAIQGIPNLIHNLAFHSPNTILTYLTTAILLTATFCLPSSIEPTLVKIQAQLRCNGFGIKCTLHAAAGGMEERREVVLGTGVYLGASLLNHACWPNAMVVFGTRKEEGRVDIDPRELVVVMTREVGRVGEPICMSYGPQVGRMDAEERRRVLREKYLFDCGCEACRESLSNGLDRFYKCPTMCPEGKLSATDETCPACRLPVDLTRRVKSETQANRLLQSGNIDSVRKCLDIQQQLYCADAHVLGATYDRLAELYARKGNFCESVSYCRKSIDVVRARFGSQSPELAREMFKLCTLLFNSQRLQEALATIRATLVLYKNHGLSHEDDVQELIGMKRFLETL